MTTAFVTGGTGFVGGGVLEAVVLDGAWREVRALARDRTGGDLVAAAGAEPVMGDVLEPESLRAGMEGCSTVFHVAGVNENCVKDPSHMFEVNVGGTRNVITAAAAQRVDRVIITSSAAAIGHREGTVGTEASPHRGHYLSDYEESKHQAESAALDLGDKLGVEVVSVNPSSVQGPGRTTGSARIILAYLNGRLRFAPDTTVGLVDIADCGRGHVAAAKRGRPGERYLLNAESRSLRELTAMIDGITGVRRRVTWLPAPIVEVAGWLGSVAQGLGRNPPICKEMVRTLLHGHSYDGTRAERELGVEYLPLRTTLARTIEWYAEFGFVKGLGESSS